MTTEALYKLYLKQEQKVCTDSRKPIKGSIFFALKGKQFDGNEYALNALQNGCAYAVVDNPFVAHQSPSCILVEDALKSLQDLAHYHRQQLNLPLIGIAGSNGKTTTKELIAAVLSQKYSVLYTPGNLNNHIGLPLTLLQLKKEHQIAIIEMGANHPGEIEALCLIAEPDFAVITSIGKEHLEGFGDIETVKKTNGELYDYVLNKNGKIFLQYDNPDLISILTTHLPSRKKIDLNDILKQEEQFILYGDIKNAENIFLSEADLRRPIVFGQYIENEEDIYVHFKWIIHSKEKCRSFKKEGFYKLQISKSEIVPTFDNAPEIHTHLLAYHNFINALCAVCIGNYFSIKEKDINTAIANYIPHQNRMQFKRTTYNLIILDAYNANPTSMMAALTFFCSKKIKTKAPCTLKTSDTTKESSLFYLNEKKVLILGDMFELGQHAEKEHRAIVQWLKENVPKMTVYLIGTEFIKAVQKEGGEFQTFESTEKFLSFLKQNPIQWKFILIKASRGMQLERVAEYL